MFTPKSKVSSLIVYGKCCYRKSIYLASEQFPVDGSYGPKEEQFHWYYPYPLLKVLKFISNKGNL